MKNWKILILGALLANASQTFAAPQMIDKVAAVVNNGVVLESDVEGMMSTVKSQAKQAGQQLPDDKTLRHQILEREIMDSIILQMGQRAGINISDQELDQAIGNIAAQNHMSFNQLRSRLAYDGVNFADYRKQIRREMSISAVRNNEVRSRVTILPQEVDSLAKQIATQNVPGTEMNISMILLPLPENPTQQQVDDEEDLAKKLTAELKQGADFGKMAVTYSADPQALKGGNMGWSKIEELPSLFTQLLSSAGKGDIVGPIRSGVGFHILKINDLRGESKNVSVNEVHAEHILLKTSPIMSDAQARSKLNQLATEIRSGKISFADAAKQNSEDPGSANQGGDLGWASPTIYDPGFASALTQLHKGEISQPVRSAFGWHLIRLLGTRQVDRTEDAEKDRAYRILFNRKFTEEAQTWMQEQRATAYVKILDNNG